MTDGALFRTDRAARWGRTDEQGAYRIEGLVPGRYTLTVDAPELGSAHGLPDVVHDFVVADADVELDLVVGADIVAGVVCRQDGSPCESARIELVPLLEHVDRITAINSVDARRRSGFWTDKEGAFRITDVAPGRYRAYVGPPMWAVDSKASVLPEFEHEPLATAVVDITKEADRDITDLTVTLRNTVDVEGQVSTDDSDLPEHVALMISDNEGRFLTEGGGSVDPQTGQFPVGQLAPGEYSALANARGYGLTRASLRVATGSKTVLDLTFTRAHNLVVKAEDDAGNPVAGANVILDLDADVLITAGTYNSHFYADFDDEEFLASDAAGCKAFRAVANGAYTVRVRCDGYADAAVPVTIAGQDAEVTVTLRPAAD